MRSSLSIGCNLDVGASWTQHTEDSPAWLPMWAGSGIQFTENEAWLDGGIVALSDILGGSETGTPGFTGAFDPAAVTGDGMAILAGNTNRPYANGAFFDLLVPFSFSVFIEWQQTETVSVNSVSYLIYGESAGGSDGIEISAGGDPPVLWATPWNGAYNEVGQVIPASLNRLIVSFEAASMVSSLNGGAAVTENLAAPDFVEFLIGHRSQADSQLGGVIKAMHFGPNGMSGAQLAAISAL